MPLHFSAARVLFCSDRRRQKFLPACSLSMRKRSSTGSNWESANRVSKKKCTMKKTSKLFVFKTFVSTSINQFSIDHSYFCISQKLHYQVCLLVKMDPEQYPDSSITFFSSFNTICLKIFVKTTMSYLCIYFGTSSIRLLRYYVRT